MCVETVISKFVTDFAGAMWIELMKWYIFVDDDNYSCTNNYILGAHWCL